MKSIDLLNIGMEECRIHLKRIEHARKKLEKIFPASMSVWESLSEDRIETMDQLVYRFAKLQDALGLRVFKSLLSVLEEPVESSSMLDKLNRLEKLGALPSKLKWQELRNLRNNLAHEYPDQAEDNLERFNFFFSEVESLIQIFHHLEKWVSAQIKS